MQTTAVRQLVRPMQVADIAQVMEVEQQSFPTMWPPTAFKRELEHNRLARYLVATQRSDSWEEERAIDSGTSLGRIWDSVRQVVSGDGTLPPPEQRPELIVGFIGVWMLVDETHIVTVAVRDGYRGRGIGELLLIAAIEVALAARQSVVTLECRVSNDVALRLYEKYGFKQVGLRPRYYSDDHEDAYVLTVSDIDTPVYESRLRQLKDEHEQRCGDYDLNL